MAEKTPKQIEVTSDQATAIAAAIESLNSAQVLSQTRIKTHEEAAQQEREAFGRVVAMHQHYINALVKAAGMNPAEFTQHGIYTEGGKQYLRAQQPQQ